MLKRKLVFHRWGSVGGKPDFDPRDVAARLRSKIADNGDFAIFDSGDAVTAVEVVQVAQTWSRLISGFSRCATQTTGLSNGIAREA